MDQLINSSRTILVTVDTALGVQSQEGEIRSYTTKLGNCVSLNKPHAHVHGQSDDFCNAHRCESSELSADRRIGLRGSRGCREISARLGQLKFRNSADRSNAEVTIGACRGAVDFGEKFASSSEGCRRVGRWMSEREKWFSRCSYHKFHRATYFAPLLGRIF